MEHCISLMICRRDVLATALGIAMVPRLSRAQSSVPATSLLSAMGILTETHHSIHVRKQ